MEAETEMRGGGEREREGRAGEEIKEIVYKRKKMRDEEWRSG